MIRCPKCGSNQATIKCEQKTTVEMVIDTEKKIFFTENRKTTDFENKTKYAYCASCGSRFASVDDLIKAGVFGD